MNEARWPDLSAPTDQELVARILAGEQDAFTVLVTRYKDYMYTIAIRIAGNEEDAADVAQETFVRAYKALGRFRGDSKFSSWLYRIAVNRSLTHLKRRKRRGVPVDIEAGPHIEAGGVERERQSTPEELVLGKELRQRVRDAVDELPAQYRAVVTLFYLEEKSYKEVSATLGIPMGTLKTHFCITRAILRKMIIRRELQNGRV